MASPKITKGAFIQIENGIVSAVPNTIVFKINPEKFVLKLKPWNPFEGDQALRGAQAPNVQPFDPQESFDFDIELDHAISDYAVENVTGVADQIAALKKLTMPSAGPIADLVNAIKGGAARPTVPVILFVWGPGLVLPVRISSFEVDVTEFNQLLYPSKATVKISIEVMTPDLFKCRHDKAVSLAIAVYKYSKVQENALALLNIANSAVQSPGLIPLPGN